MLSRFWGSKEKLIRPSLNSPALETQHVDRIRNLFRLGRSLQTLRCHYDLELPKIVLLGSAGVKPSFLLECLTGLKLAPEFEYEQRTPIEFRLHKILEGDWACRIKLRRLHKEKDRRHGIENVEEIPYGKIIDDPRKVAGLLREAHSYLLDQENVATQNNMLKQDSDCIGKRRQRNESISKSMICLEIQGNSIEDFTLITLPSLIAIHSSQALQELTLDYLATNCWILLLTQQLDHLQVHRDFGLVQQVDPAGDRTLGLCREDNTAWSSSLRNRSVTIRSRLGALHTRSPGEQILNSTSRPCHSTWWNSNRSDGTQSSTWKVGWLGGKSPSGTSFDMPCNDLELKVFLNNLSCELFEKSMPKILELISKLYLVDKSMSLPKSTEVSTFNDVLRYTHAACASDINHLITSTITGKMFDSEIESIYKLLRRRAFAVLPIFIPLASQEDDIAAFRQIIEFSDLNLYANAYRLKEFENTAIFSHRPRVYLKEARHHLKSMNTEAPEIAVRLVHKTPLMELPIKKWRIYACDAMASAICLLQGTIEYAIIKRCQEAPSFQPTIMKIIFSQINQIFDNAKKSIAEALEFELVPYTEFFPHFSKLRKRLLDDYNLSCHLLSQKTESQRDLTKKPQAKLNSWDLEINACADASAYLNLALANFLDKTSMIIEKELLEQLALCDLFQLPTISSPELIDDLGENSPTSENPHCGDATTQPPQVAAQLAHIIESTMRAAADELYLLDPFMSS